MTFIGILGLIGTLDTRDMLRIVIIMGTLGPQAHWYTQGTLLFLPFSIINENVLFFTKILLGKLKSKLES